MRSILIPASVVHEVGEDEFCCLVGWRFRGENHKQTYKTTPQSELCYCEEEFAVAVEKKNCEGINELICYDNRPGLDRAVRVPSQRNNRALGWEGTYIFG
jgi:hypothetical protein